ncbi:MAG TPA: SCO family protein [Gammaproteobacteria bacterium]
MRDMNRNTLLIIIVAVLAAAAGGVIGGKIFAPDVPPGLTAGTLLSEPRPLPDFRMTRHDMATFTREDFKGNWNLVFFGFTHCPDVCPNTLFLLDRVVKQVEQGGVEPPGVVFVSVDSVRDTPEAMAKYVKYFNPAFIGLTGDATNLQKLTQAMSVAYEFRPLEGGDGEDDYTVIHSSAVLLVDPKARLRAIFTPPLRADAITGDLVKLITD